ncbi:hypothetical protein OEG92_01845 [Polaribacter sejongensis]|uniref:hypothetical protein n=1 Tax=Polaribacter sejongensis TaxID=985043 RepID=UPI0035A6D8EA
MIKSIGSLFIYKISLIILLLFLQNGFSQEAKPRFNYNAKYEPEKGIYHGAGQDKNGFQDYVNAVGQDKMPAIYMTYVNITSPVKRIERWGKSLKRGFR